MFEQEDEKLGTYPATIYFNEIDECTYEGFSFIASRMHRKNVLDSDEVFEDRHELMNCMIGIIERLEKFGYPRYWIDTAFHLATEYAWDD